MTTQNDNYLIDDDAGVWGCECELDYQCGLHAGQPTHIESRFVEDEPSWR